MKWKRKKKCCWRECKVGKTANDSSVAVNFTARTSHLGVFVCSAMPPFLLLPFPASPLHHRPNKFKRGKLAACHQDVSEVKVLPWGCVCSCLDRCPTVWDQSWLWLWQLWGSRRSAPVLQSYLLLQYWSPAPHSHTPADRTRDGEAEGVLCLWDEGLVMKSTLTSLLRYLPDLILRPHITVRCPSFPFTWSRNFPLIWKWWRTGNCGTTTPVYRCSTPTHLHGCV